MKSLKILCGVLLLLLSTQHTYAMGNHPEASACPLDKPYVVFCSHSLHNLEGWVGKCYAKREEAERNAELHAQKEHQGNTRWTGVLEPDKRKKTY